MAKRVTKKKPKTVEVCVEAPAPPGDPKELAAWLSRVVDVRVPSVPVLETSDAPLAYLTHSFFEGRFALRRDGTFVDLQKSPLGGDCVVWANRGGGKTFLGAVATVLDMVFKPGIEVRILGGSLEQSRRMYEHLRRLFACDELSDLVDGKSTETRLKLVNGSRVEILAQSERSVRGTRVQKLRCDEADLFSPEIWEAAQLVTRSKKIVGPWGPTVRGSVEVLSTMHVPMGLMWRVVADARRVDDSGSPAVPAGREDDKKIPGGDRRGTQDRGTQDRGTQDRGTQDRGTQEQTRVLFRWGVVDALEHCGEEFECGTCNLEPECGGSAKRRDEDEAGHLGVRDARVMKSRVSKAAWESEMLCLRPRRSDAVFPEFDMGVHVLEPSGVPRVECLKPRVFDPLREDAPHGPVLIGGMDFGVRSPTVVVWAVLEGDVVRVVDEYHETGRTLREHIAAIESSAWGKPAWIGVDPAGGARNEQTGASNAAVLRRAGLEPKFRRSSIAEGLELIRARLRPASGPPTLFIAPQCEKLIESMQRYHYNIDNPRDDAPVKDGPDHFVDALRYMLLNLTVQPTKKGWW